MKIKTCVSALLATVAFGVVTGCGTLPSTEVMKAETASFVLPKAPEPGKAIVYVVRPAQLGTGALIRFNVFLDNQEAASEMGFTRSSQYIYFNVTPGTHKIYSKAQNWADTEITAKAGDVIYLRQEPLMGAVLPRNNLSKLDEVQGKYQVKQLTLGTILKSSS